MPERPYARYTREKTWAALYAQHINACYALVPNSATNNSIWLIRCKSPEETASRSRALLNQASEIDDFFSARRTPDQAPAIMRNAGEAVVLARSSDYWRYHLETRPGLALVVAGQHDSYLHLPVWETSSNRRYAPRETALKIDSPEFERARRTQQAHNTLLGALAAGDHGALAYLATLPERTRRRIRQEADALQSDRYQGQPLAFHTENERQAIGAKISAGLIRYHARRRSG